MAPSSTLYDLPGSGPDAAVHQLPENKVSSIPVSEAERLSGIITPENLGAAIGILHRDGIVVLDNIVDIAHIDALNNKLCADVPALIANPKTNWNGGRDKGNISQSPPYTKEYMFEDIWANRLTISVIESILGPKPHVNYVNGNTALPRTHGRQEVHADLSFNYGMHPFAMVANYYLSDTSEENGATEVWLRSHRDTHFDVHKPSQSWIEPKHLKESARGPFPPIRASVKRGSVVIRDLRLWHAGRSNPSPNPRIMLAFVHFPAWYENAMRITMPLSAREFLESVKDRVVYDVEYLAGNVDYLDVPFQANFESANEAYKATIPKCSNISLAEKRRMDEAAKA